MRRILLPLTASLVISACATTRVDRRPDCDDALRRADGSCKVAASAKAAASVTSSASAAAASSVATVPSTATKTGQPRPPLVARADRPSIVSSAKDEITLMREIVTIEQELTKTSISTRRYAELTRGLAKDYFELERLKEREAIRLTTEIGEAQTAGKPTLELKNKRTKTSRSRDKAQERVVVLDRYLLDRVPGFANGDEVTYDLAYEYESFRVIDPADKDELKREREMHGKAVETYLKLANSYPTSPYVAPAYLALGEIYFDEAAAGRADWAIPLASFDRVVNTSSPPANRSWAYAQYKKGFAYWNLGQKSDAIAALKAARDAAKRHSDQVSGTEIVADAQAAIDEI